MNGRGGIVLGDLGHAKALENSNNSNHFLKSNSLTSNRAYGTNNYLAPETYNTTEKIDIWYIFNYFLGKY